MLFRRLEILSDRQNVAAGGQNIIHEDRDLLVRLSEADHESGLGQNRRILFLYIAQNAQRPLVARLRADGVRVVMLTGDRKSAADAVAEELGIAEVHSELLPEDKVTQVERLLGEGAPGKYLAFVGDGINDAPVLARADLGAAMGGIGSDAAIEAADIVLMDDDPRKLSLAMRISRKTMRLVWENIVFALAVKAVCLVLGALGIANMWVAIFADVGVMVLCVLNAARALNTKHL